MGIIEWLPIADLPDEFKDGRQVLLWCGESGADVGTWSSDSHWSDEDIQAGGYWEALYECAKITGVTHFAEITPPT